jgi:hypothetical protein
MRPERSRETGRAARIARGRGVVKADLAWLGGHPTGKVGEAGLGWTVPAAGGRPGRDFTLDRAALHRATRALTELEHRYADVLAEILDEPRTWIAGARVALVVLKPVLHAPKLAVPSVDAALEAGAVRPALAAAVRAATGSARRVLDAAVWMSLVDPGRLARIVAFAAEHERVLSTLRAASKPDEAEAAFLRLALVAEAEGAKRVQPLARLLSNPTLFDSPTTGVDYARALSAHPHGQRAPRPRATLGKSLAAWIAPLLAAEPRARRGALALVELLDLAPAAHEWTAWWSRLGRAERLAKGEADAERDALVMGKANRLAEAAPRSLHGDTLANVLTRTLVWSDAAHREAQHALRELPAFEDGVPVRLSFLETFVDLHDDAGSDKLAALLAALAKYLARTRSLAPRSLAPWSRLVDRKRRGHWSGAPEGTLVEDVPPARWPVFYDALARAAEDGKSDLAQIANALLVVVPHVADAGRALAVARAMLEHHASSRPPENVKMAFELCGHDADKFALALAAMGRSGDKNLLRGLTALRKAGGDDLARAALLDDFDRIVACGRKLAVLALAGGERKMTLLPAAPRDAAWVEDYPGWAVPSLRRLAAVDVHAERIARRTLGDDVRAPAVVRRELAHLEKLDRSGEGMSDRMRRRMENLRARVADPRPAPAAVREHLLGKIDRAARRAELARFEASLDEAIREELPASLGLRPPPDWLFTPRTLEQLAPIVAFEAPMRALAVRVLRMRAGPPPWDLRDDPANRAYLQRLVRSGVDVQPWVEGIGTTVVTTEKGQIAHLALEDDPLEILDMGKHFSTCLTPGDINYFSTFANVADVNKRVLYARSPEGKVLGRCLFALTGAGGLLVFNFYAHDGNLGFEGMATEFARDLAARMRVRLCGHGDVPRLVAPDWYDDGTMDVAGRFPFLQDGAEFRAALATLTPSAFVDEATRLFAPLPLGALTLPLLVTLKEVEARPELLVPLLPVLASSEGLPLDTVARAAGLLAKTPEATTAARALVPRIVARLAQAADDAQGWLQAAVASVVEACPVETLRLLRQTRPRNVHGWNEEHDHRRLEMAARAYDTLHRPRQAASMYRHAAKHCWSPAMRQKLEARAAELEKQLGARR